MIKLIRDKVTGYPAGYGFLEFPTQRGAQQVLEAYNGQLVRKTESFSFNYFLVLLWIVLYSFSNVTT